MTGVVATPKGQARDPHAASLDAETLSSGNTSLFRGRPATAFAVLAFGLIVVLYFWFIQHYSVNTVWVDQWSDIPIIRQAFNGHLTLGSLWAQHGENRVLFQNLIALLLAYTTHYNVVVEEYLSGVMAVAATGLFILAHHRRSPSTPWLYYVPLALVMLSFVQEGNMLFGYALSWYIVLLALAGAIYLLDRPTLTWPVLVAGIVVAIVGSYSNLYGLLIWPAVLVLFLQRRRGRALVLTWLGSAFVTSVVYFIGFSFAATRSNNGYVLSHPSTTIDFFLIALGDGLGVQQQSNYYTDVAFFGIAILGVSCWVLSTYGRRADETSGSPIGVAMICFGLLFCAFMTLGRVWFGLGLAGWSRYTTYDLLVLAGCYVAVLDRPAEHAPRGFQRRIRQLAGLPKDAWSAGGAWDEPIRIGVVVFLTAAIGFQVILGTKSGISQAEGWYQSQILAADLTVNINRAPEYLIYSALCEEFCSLRQDIAFMRAHHLSLFDTSSVDRYKKEGWRAIPVSALSVYATVIKPTDGATLRGSQWLLGESTLAATGDYGASRINFYVTGKTLRKALIFPGTHTQFGWLGAWNTGTVPNGTYTIRSVAYTLVGPGTWSPPVQVSVAN
jgi:hypothetical protein